MNEHIGMGKLNQKGAAAILLLFYLGSILNMPSDLGADGWIALLAGLAAAFPLLLLLARLVRIMPGMGLYEMLEYTLGRVLAIFVSVLYFAYFILLAAMTQVRYGVFVQLTSLTNTPMVVILILFAAVGVYLAKSGVETLGKWSVLTAAVVILSAVVLTLFAIPSMRVENLLPIATSGGRAIVRGGVRQAIFPFGGAVVMLALSGRLDCKANPYRVFLFGAAIACVFFVLTFLRDAAVLGAGSMDTLRYPFFQAAGVIRVGAIETRIESLAAVPILLAGVTKAAVYLFAAVGAVRRVLGVRAGRRVFIPAAIFSVGLAAVLSGHLGVWDSFPTVYLRIALLFQLGIPVLMWVAAEVKRIRRPVVAEE
ncbi:MAG: spore germination protein [Oscillospiraceae bacterium]|nr:spore germination protein [Oscillospiraceae bacterium]